MCRITFHFFSLYFPEMRRKLWPKAPPKEGALGQISKNFQVYFRHINFFKKPNKKIFNRAKELHCDATIFAFWFYIVYFLKKNGNWKIAQDCRLSPTSWRCATLNQSFSFFFGCRALWRVLYSVPFLLYFFSLARNTTRSFWSRPFSRYKAKMPRKTI